MVMPSSSFFWNGIPVSAMASSPILSQSQARPSRRMTMRGLSSSPTIGRAILTLSSRSMARLRVTLSLPRSSDLEMSSSGTFASISSSNSFWSSSGALPAFMTFLIRSSTVLRSRSSWRTRSDPVGHMLGAEKSASFLPRSEKIPLSDPPLCRNMRFFHSVPTFSELMA